MRLLANLLSPLPYIVTSHSSRAYKDAVRGNLAEFRPNLVLCEWTPYVVYAKALTSVKTLISAHNVEADIWQRYYENETNPIRRWYIGEQWRKVERFERAAVGWVDGALTVSALDRGRLLRSRPGMPIAVIPNGVEMPPLVTTDHRPQTTDQRTVLFLGRIHPVKGLFDLVQAWAIVQ